MNVFSQQMKDSSEAKNKQLKMATFNAINRLLASGDELKSDQKRSALTSYNKFISLGGSIDDFKKNKSAMKQLISNRESLGVEMELMTANKWRHLYNRSKEKGIEFDLTLSDVKRLLSRKKCQYSGVYMSLDSGSKEYITIERIDNMKGYTKDNVIAVCRWANNLKSVIFESPNEIELKYEDIDNIVSFLEGVKRKVSVGNKDKQKGN